MQETYLEGLPLFKDLTPEERTELEALFEPVSFEAGEAIFEEGGSEEHLYVLTSGTVEVHKEVFPDRWYRLDIVEAPAVIGEMGLVSEPPAAATVTAKEPVEAHCLPHEIFLEKLDAGSEAAYKVAYEIGYTLAERMAHTNECIAKTVAQFEESATERDFDVFRDKLMQEWSF